MNKKQKITLLRAQLSAALQPKIGKSANENTYILKPYAPAFVISLAVAIGISITLIFSDKKQPCSKIKAITTAKGEKIYYTPDHPKYNSIIIDKKKGDRLFCDELGAMHAGWDYDRKILKAMRQ